MNTLSTASPSDVAYLRLQRRVIPWDRIRMLEMQPRSVTVMLDDRSKVRFEFASQELMDTALRKAFTQW